LRLIFWLCFFNVTSNSHCQNYNIRFEPLYENLQERTTESYFSLKIVINGDTLKYNDSTNYSFKASVTNFDTITYSFIYNKSLIEDTFLCKFKAYYTYSILPCTCCGLFLIVPKDSISKRGFVKTKNNSTKNICANVSEIELLNVPKQTETEFIFSSISMNCGFRPSEILITKPKYSSEKYNYENWSQLSKKKQMALNKKRETYVIKRWNYLFYIKKCYKLKLEIN